MCSTDIGLDHVWLSDVGLGHAWPSDIILDHVGQLTLD